jgi:hypothetical protein
VNLIRPDGYLADVYPLAYRDIAGAVTAAITGIFAITTPNQVPDTVKGPAA